jgi:hypothetical protein
LYRDSLTTFVGSVFLIGGVEAFIVYATVRYFIFYSPEFDERSDGVIYATAIEVWTEHWNRDPQPFVWHKPAEEMFAKVRRGRAALTQAKSATRHKKPSDSRLPRPSLFGF